VPFTFGLEPLNVEAMTGTGWFNLFTLYPVRERWYNIIFRRLRWNVRLNILYDSGALIDIDTNMLGGKAKSFISPSNMRR